MSFPPKPTIIFDYHDMPHTAEEREARRALRELSHAFRAYKHQKPSTPPPLLPAPPAALPQPPSIPSAITPSIITPPPANTPPAPQQNADRPRPVSAEKGPQPVSGSGFREEYTENIARKRGGQPGNNNALKYGFYSRRIPVRELEGLDQTAVTSLKDEIDVMRVFSRKVAELGADVDDLSRRQRPPARPLPRHHLHQLPRPHPHPHP